MIEPDSVPHAARPRQRVHWVSSSAREARRRLLDHDMTFRLHADRSGGDLGQPIVRCRHYDDVDIGVQDVAANPLRP